MNKFTIIDFVLHTSMAMPREVDLAKTYYHGTSKEENAKNILQNGIQPPNLELKKKNKLTPEKGKVYITPALDYALIYALGYNMAGEDLSGVSDVKQKKEFYGYIFVIDGKQLKDIQPDEDGVGEILYDYVAMKNGKQTVAGSGLSKEQLPKLEWLDNLAKQVLTPLQYQKAIRYDDYADLAVAGKKLNRYMSDSQKLALIDAGAHIAHGGKIDFKECWRIDKRRSQELNRDGSNFFQIAEKIR
jgi:hypothetical protein